MADLTTQVGFKYPFHVFSGETEINSQQVAVEADPAGIVAVTLEGQTVKLFALAAGTATLSLTKGAQSGSVTVEVTPADELPPLTVQLGAPEPI